MSDWPAPVGAWIEAAEEALNREGSTDWGHSRDVAEAVAAKLWNYLSEGLIDAPALRDSGAEPPIDVELDAASSPGEPSPDLAAALDRILSPLADVPHNHDDGICIACRRDGALIASRAALATVKPEEPGLAEDPEFRAEFARRWDAVKPEERE